MNETRMTGPEPLHVPGRRVCRTCCHVLDQVDSSGGVTIWQHTVGTEQDPTVPDHECVPVLDTEVPTVVEKCDFCSGGGTTWLVPARNFDVSPALVANGIEVAPALRSRGDWGACGLCAELIRANQWTRLLQRVKETWPNSPEQPMDRETERFLRKTYRRLRVNITGDVRKIER